MSQAAAERLLENRATVLIVSLLTIVLFALGNLPWQLGDYDQAKQAFTSWQLVTASRSLYQTTPNGKVATKAPLVAWTSALLYKVTRWWEFAWRAPSFAAAVAIAAILWRRAGVISGALGGLIALAAFSLNLLIPRLATLLRTDMPLALVTFLIVLGVWVRVIRADRSSANMPSPRR
jgi:4-amino-4-deoxy-L-arabinose transferase-like glycosyltransferase